ncbi:MAG: DUF4105 domain-containing protein [Bacteroidales bacterium]|nr:DUF4105 domain-containing protein [Bacteroidales bacterium]MDT8372921.1 DUF4105 domain-containing protein [Bacteroidales bacterium]
MKKLALFTVLLTLLLPLPSAGQVVDSADVYIITCAPGTESYSIYGHTALRVAVRGTTIDRVYNWGIFDFSTPNFVYRFAKGRLDYMLGAYGYEDFLREYISEGRSVWSQKLNLTAAEKERLFELINENLKPENVKYRYDFFFDNCATRVRDIVAAAATDTVIFPEKERKKQNSFRRLVDPKQKVLPWLDLGADMLLGLQADKKATPFDEMFLPDHLMNNMGNTVIVHDGSGEPLTGPAEVVAEFSASDRPSAKAWVPQAVFWLILLLILLMTFVPGRPKLVKAADFVIYFIYSVIAMLLVFTNLFSEHDALHFNLLFLGINILIPVLFVLLFTRNKAVLLNRIAFFISLSWLPVSLIAGQGINPALIPLVLIITVRLYSHCGFGKEL